MVEEKMDWLEIMVKVCSKCPYDKKYRIGIKCTKFKSYPYYLEDCPNIENIMMLE